MIGRPGWHPDVCITITAWGIDSDGGDREQRVGSDCGANEQSRQTGAARQARQARVTMDCYAYAQSSPWAAPARRFCVMASSVGRAQRFPASVRPSPSVPWPVPARLSGLACGQRTRRTRDRAEE